MINFELNPYRWEMDIIMNNINLNKIEFLNNSISIEFLNSYNGAYYKKLLCNNVWKFISENNYEEKEEAPYFIGEVRLKKLEELEIIEAFKFLKYTFEIPNSNEFNLVCIDSGDRSIKLICKTVEIL